MNSKTFNQSLKRAWQILKWKVIFVAALVFVLVVAPIGVKGQLGLDPCCAIISAGLSTISGLLQNVVAKPLGQIQQIQQQAANFQQQVIYPTSAINNARGLAGQTLGQLRQMTQVFKLPTASASCPRRSSLNRPCFHTTHSPWHRSARLTPRFMER
jgi:hypothetical protein